MRDKREMRDLGAERPRFYFSYRPGHARTREAMLEDVLGADPSFRCSRSMQECRGPRSSVHPWWRAGSCARAWLLDS